MDPEPNGFWRFNKGNAVSRRKRILLGHLERRGDCLYATTVARQIKHDYPDCHLTWAIGSICRPVIEGNPFVDEIWEIPQSANANVNVVWNQFEAEATRRKNNGEFDEVFLTQVHPGNFQNYDGTCRSSIFRGYPRPITVPVAPVVRLSDAEVNNVKHFAELNNISSNDKVILFECASASGQSFVTPEFALDTAKLVLQNVPDIKFILTSNIKIDNKIPNIVDGSSLSFIENAELTKYCTLLVGCSSGVSWLATSDWAKPLPKIQLLKKRTYMYASMIHDAKYFGLSTDQIMELQDCTPELLADCIITCLRENFSVAKSKYHTDVPIKFDYYFKQLYGDLLRKNKFLIAVKAICSALDRYKNNNTSAEELLTIINKIFVPYLNFNYSKIPYEDRKDILDIMSNYHITNKIKRSKTFSFSLLIIRVIAGKHTAITRIFLRDIFNKIAK